jgi:hypothetical protein
LICAAALASFNYGYSNNVIAGTLAQTSFGLKFLSGPNALQIIDGLVSGYEYDYRMVKIDFKCTHMIIGSLAALSSALLARLGSRTGMDA